FIDDFGRGRASQERCTTGWTGIGEGFGCIEIVWMAMNDGVNERCANTPTVGYQADEILYQRLAVRWCLVRWPLAFGDRVDHIDDDKGALLGLQQERISHGIPPEC